MYTLNKKVILLTGGSEGIGWACAKAYAKAGGVVCILDKQLLSDEKRYFTQDSMHSFFQGDVSREEDVQRAIHFVIERYGKLDVIHNNAGIAIPCKPLHETEDKEWQSLMNVNLNSVLYTTRHGFAYLKTSKGSIINTSSLIGLIGQNNHAAYAATKGAMNSLTKAMALDYAKYGIRVNAVLPAGVNTPTLDLWKSEQPNPGEIDEYLKNIHPLGYLPDGDVVADTCVFLASDAARFITGNLLPISGGAELGYRSLK